MVRRRGSPDASPPIGGASGKAAERPSALSVDRRRQVRAPGVQPGDVLIDRVRREGPRREPTSPIDRTERWRTDPRSGGEFAVEDADQLEVGIPEPDDPVVRPERFVAFATARCQPDRPFEVGSRRIRIRAGDNEVVDPGEHGASLSPHGPDRYHHHPDLSATAPLAS